MRLKKLAFTTAASLGLATLAGAAAAAVIQNSHVLTVQLPDGGTAHIRYFGDTPPQVRVEPAEALAPAAWPGSMIGLFDPAFPALDRAMAQMDRQADLMFAQAQHMTGATATPDANGLMRADFGRLPPGATGYSYVSTFTSNGACTRSVEYRSTGKGPPQVISKTSGDCGAPAKAAASAATTSAAAQPAPHLTRTAYHTAT